MRSSWVTFAPVESPNTSTSTFPEVFGNFPQVRFLPPAHDFQIDPRASKDLLGDPQSNEASYRHDHLLTIVCVLSPNTPPVMVSSYVGCLLSIEHTEIAGWRENSL